mmetsp:Transcript_110006/g.306553  ORF Transcript_110006/g.306553 Transcript_110006/m.306553 type:complete len:219 (-) Transcript_110006:371-1027(-)
MRFLCAQLLPARRSAHRLLPFFRLPSTKIPRHNANVSRSSASSKRKARTTLQQQCHTELIHRQLHVLLGVNAHGDAVDAAQGHGAPLGVLPLRALDTHLREVAVQEDHALHRAPARGEHVQVPAPDHALDECLDKPLRFCKHLAAHGPALLGLCSIDRRYHVVLQGWKALDALLLLILLVFICLSFAKVVHEHAQDKSESVALLHVSKAEDCWFSAVE